MKNLLIGGGGPVGMALTLAAAQDMSVELIAPPFRSAGRCYALGAAAVNFLTSATKNPLPDNTPVRRFLLSAGGRQNVLNSPDNTPLCRIINETPLINWLQQSLRRANIATHNGRIIKCRIHEDGVEAYTDGGQTLAAHLLAAADGARSPIAQTLGIGAAISRFSQRALTAQLTIKGLALDTAAQWFAHQDILALLPTNNGTFSLIWSMPDEKAKILTARGISAVAAAVTARTGFAATAASDSVCNFALTAIRRAVRATQKTAFVGDSAQVIHPLAGQGLNIGLTDAARLLYCLRRHQTHEAALADYAVSGRRTAAWHIITSVVNQTGYRAAPIFAAAGLPPMARLIARAANA